MKRLLQSRSMARDIGGTLALAVVLSLLYNAFSPNRIPLIRSQPAKISVSDSALFAPSPSSDSLRQVLLQDTAKPKGVKVIAPLHEHALSGQGPVGAGSKAEPVYKIVTLDQVKRLLSEHRGLFIDAREAEEFRKGHIAGARNIPAMEEDQHFAEIVQLPRDTVVVIYCNSAQCHLGRMLAEFMGTMEFRKLFLYDDGWEGWTKAHMPVDTTLGAP